MNFFTFKKKYKGLVYFILFITCLGVSRKKTIQFKSASNLIRFFAKFKRQTFWNLIFGQYRYTVDFLESSIILNFLQL